MTAVNVATLGAGCFWGVERSFARKFGAAIKNIRVGYSGGSKDSPSYKDVCTGTTNHAEVVNFEFDAAQVSYATILDFFFRMHDPTTLNRQGGDKGTQYRSSIFYHSEEQKAIAEQVIKRVQPAFGAAQISTTLEPFRKFWDGEEYHQDYLTKNPDGYECPTHFERSWEKIAKEFTGVVPSDN
ncbi:peptide methionine sulfoxide reductase [Rhizoclosmatium globosum]|uniref:peptide-methionine (S)-S-oxide reductase n=1 Tax=Rhizoclosmatium globosum TaxID=329046 RepID=A0A1Y2BNH8_9FUNG|nr:Peptide-methionine (S)-S-oxide reductase [Rhizoclosmatium hyalinum]KAJ3295563.1 Peptide-methionine (S)-S-oxide reductase [Rhizoclosmatium sp. JEL0117]ORY36127.1 peptide methionine sulfoxide reductase [Rhizoclosmatium globosum]|eukprot:ORY36127.1 peptide methionine sulfoxide reductase [Rhizoclosmatium globosum]